jgi:hypothetical protein
MKTMKTSKFFFLLTSTLILSFLSSCQLFPPVGISSKPSLTKNLSLVANGEDFVRQGFVSKDGWRIDFDHVYVNFSEAIAYQSDPPFNAEANSEIQAQTKVALLREPQKIDLAQGDQNAAPILVSQVNAPHGFYNAIAWKVSQPNPEEATISIQGKATKDNQTVNFLINLEDELDYTCGEFVGDARKGFVADNTVGELETTFHFDHIFGDQDTPMDDALNADALGFQPLADLAENESLEINQATLKTKLSPEDYGKLEKAIASLGHVGEGHCQIKNDESTIN